MHSLSDSTQGYTYTIKWMFGLPEVMKSMHDMDIHEGSTVRVLRKFHDSLIISSANRKIVLGNEVADRIQVQCFIFKFGENLQDKGRINAVTFSIYPAYSYLCSIRRQFFRLNNCSLNYKKKETQMRYTTIKIMFKCVQNL